MDDYKWVFIMDFNGWLWWVIMMDDYNGLLSWMILIDYYIWL